MIEVNDIMYEFPTVAAFKLQCKEGDLYLSLDKTMLLMCVKASALATKQAVVLSLDGLYEPYTFYCTHTTRHFKAKWNKVNNMGISIEITDSAFCDNPGHSPELPFFEAEDDD